MAKARDLINRSLKLIGVLAEGETASAEAANDGLDTLNEMVDSWSNERLFIFQTIKEYFTLQAGVASYSIGPGGDFDTDRPMKIEIAKLRDLSTSDQPEYDIDLLTEQEYRDIRFKAIESERPSRLYYDTGFPLGKIYIYRTPNTANELVLNSWKQLSSFASLDSEIVLPPGYMKALRFNLAIDLAADYDKAPSQTVITGAIRGEESIKRMNAKTPLMRSDSAMARQRGRGRYNILVGD